MCVFCAVGYYFDATLVFEDCWRRIGGVVDDGVIPKNS